MQAEVLPDTQEFALTWKRGYSQRTDRRGAREGLDGIIDAILTNLGSGGPSEWRMVFAARSVHRRAYRVTVPGQADDCIAIQLRQPPSFFVKVCDPFVQAAAASAR